MIWTWTNFFLMQGIGNLLWYVLGREVLMDFLGFFYDKFPAAISGSGYTFMLAIINNFPIFLLLGGLLFVYVSSQRSATAEGYYR